MQAQWFDVGILYTLWRARTFFRGVPLLSIQGQNAGFEIAGRLWLVARIPPWGRRVPSFT